MSSGFSNSINGSTTGLARLISRPFDFDFVQAVTLLHTRVETDVSARHFVGFDNSLHDEVVRFRVSPSLRNNSCQVFEVRAPEESDACYELTIPFLGLIGVNGVLPRHYTQTVISRVKEHDFAMRDFFDLFHHRTISMFFRASVKYRLPFVYQFNAVQSPARDDAITQAMRCLVGLGEPSLRHQLSISDDTVLHYGGHFSDSMPTAHSLEHVVEDYFGLPTQVLQFQFEWLYIEPSEQTQLTAKGTNRLGLNVVVGQRVPSFHSRFRIRVGPVTWRDFVELLPISTRVAKLADLVRLYVGISLDFDLQVTVAGREIPECSFRDDQPPRLGWTTWLFSKPVDSIVEDAVFNIGTF